MATENPTFHAPEEHVGPQADDVLNAASDPGAGNVETAETSDTAPGSSAADAPARAKRPRIRVGTAESVEEPAEETEKVDFSEEDAALAASDAGLEIEGETAEEAAAARPAADEKFAGRSKEELVGLFARMLEEQPVQAIRREVEALKIAFYRLRRAEVEAARRAFLESGGAEEAFAAPVDGVEVQLKELFKEYRRRRDDFIASLEAEKEKNLQVKLGIIGELKELVGSDETLNHTFNRFRELQNRWKETGIVPQANVKDLWETYNLHVENFYNFIKINKELRDLDLKKNYEQKVALCEQAEALVLEPSVVEAFHKLQKLHDEWRETGPVANEFKEALWERFREASTRINKQHQEHFDALKSEQLKNLGLKTELCVAAEELTAQPLTARKEWNRASERLLEIQKTWKTIGFAPKKDNNRIYERFRAACDRFFERKSTHFASVDGEHETNLQKKLALLAEMEAADVTKGGYEVIRDFQRRWGEIGFVPIKQKDAIQKRYKAVVDNLFDTLRGTERDRSMNRFREKISTLRASGDRRVRSEREKLANRVRQLEQEAAVLENNIGFFGRSKGAEALIADVRSKIARLRDEIAATVEKIRLLDCREAGEQQNENIDK